jgi:MoxR-like ATPase
MTQPITAIAASLPARLDEVLLGKSELTQLVCAAFFAGGHVLLEGLPGLGKTVLAKSMATLTGLEHKRIQFTPDLMPADITGTHLLDHGAGGGALRFVPGPVFTHFLLADEINRASPKTQAALLEAMAEASVTHMGESRKLAAPFFVMATQNPIEMEGVNSLPEAQLDRFAIKYDVPATDEAVLLAILRTRKRGDPPELHPLMTREQVLACQAAVDEIFLPEPVAVLIAKLVARTAPKGHDGAVRYGASPRGAIWLARIARSLALLAGRPGVAFEDVAQAAPHVLGHRIILSHSARIDGVSPRELVLKLLEECERDVLADGGTRAASATPA